mmetsp:Transcript_5403/g.13337  ORF Transcript_5403/g.13337 Transcript_5403/m.13337 type:complete len:425 (-) Transcript_5403:133-1407(-)
MRFFFLSGSASSSSPSPSPSPQLSTPSSTPSSTPKHTNPAPISSATRLWSPRIRYEAATILSDGILPDRPGFDLRLLSQVPLFPDPVRNERGDNITGRWHCPVHGGLRQGRPTASRQRPQGRLLVRSPARPRLLFQGPGQRDRLGLVVRLCGGLVGGAHPIGPLAHRQRRRYQFRAAALNRRARVCDRRNGRIRRGVVDDDDDHHAVLPGPGRSDGHQHWTRTIPGHPGCLFAVGRSGHDPHAGVCPPAAPAADPGKTPAAPRGQRQGLDRCQHGDVQHSPGVPVALYERRQHRLRVDQCGDHLQARRRRTAGRPGGGAPGDRDGNSRSSSSSNGSNNISRDEDVRAAGNGRGQRHGNRVTTPFVALLRVVSCRVVSRRIDRSVCLFCLWCVVPKLASTTSSSTYHAILRTTNEQEGHQRSYIL